MPNPYTDTDLLQHVWVVKTPSVAESTTCGGAPVSPRSRFAQAAWRCNIVTSPLKPNIIPQRDLPNLLKINIGPPEAF
jgi:hypothetical protein